MAEGSERCPLSGLAVAISISSMNAPHLGYSIGWRERIAGLSQQVPLADGRLAPYINLDNAATTPPLQEVLDAVYEFLPYYSSVHRGAGFKSRVSTAAYDQAHETIARFVGADQSTNTVIFGKNTTEAINKLAYRYPLGRRNIVLSTGMEHHSNDLPWRGRAQVVRARITGDGRLDEDDVDRLIAAFGDRIALLTVSGASNVTGFVQPIHRLARKAHAVGASILVDAAQLAPHRRIDVRPDHDPEHLDFVAFSAHKMYAPFGTGALVGRRDIFLEGVPEYQGGGTVEVVTPTEVRWAGLPDREEAGTPNVVGAVAMAAAARVLMAADWDALERHEACLTTYALERLQSLPGITIYGASDPSRCADRVGVIPFNLGDMPHALVAAILGYEGGIGVRSGCFCAQPYVAHLLGRAESEPDRWSRARLGWRHIATTRHGAHQPGRLQLLRGRGCPGRDVGTDHTERLPESVPLPAAKLGLQTCWVPRFGAPPRGSADCGGNRMTRVAIIGGGPGGLMTAHLLEQKCSCRTTLFEASDRLGGKVRTCRFDSAPVKYEAGVAECYDYEAIGDDPLRNLMRELGLDITPTGSNAIVLDGALMLDDTEIGQRCGDRTLKAIEDFRRKASTILPLSKWYRGLEQGDNGHPWARRTFEEMLNEVADPVAKAYLRVAVHSDLATEPNLTNGLNGLRTLLGSVPLLRNGTTTGVSTTTCRESSDYRPVGYQDLAHRLAVQQTAEAIV